MRNFLKPRNILLLLLVLLFSLPFLGIRILLNPFSIFIKAPGCIERDEVIFGGCFGTQQIPFQFSFTGDRCLKIGTNTCNSPNVEIQNDCAGSVYLDNRSFTEKDGNIYIDKVKEIGLSTTHGSVKNKPVFILTYTTPPECVRN